MNENERNLLDSAARLFRSRVTPGSRHYELLDSEMPATAIGQDSTSPQGYDPTRPASARMGLPATERLARSVEFNLPQIGDMPPAPPTLRGRIGAYLVAIVRRALFWYTAQIKTLHAAVAEAARELLRTVQDLHAQQQRERHLITEVRQRLTELERQGQFNQDAHASLESELSLYRESTHDRLLQLEQEQARHKEVAAVRWERIEKAVSQHEQTHFTTQVKEIRRQMDEARAHLLRHELRFKMLLREIRQGAIPPAGIADEPAHMNDSLFVDHAASFRGSRSDIKKRLTVYLPYAQEAFGAALKSPALDLGCGRGEWLELLGETGIRAKGIDMNRELVNACRDLGLDAMEADISHFLQTLPDESFSIVSAFHILEHLPFPDVVELIDQAARILRPGGIVIFETPNPKNLFVSSNNFYMDPTHRHPIPSEFLAFLVEARGLCDPKVIPLSPYPDYFRLQESDCPAVRFINEHFYGPQDYAVLAKKA